MPIDFDVQGALKAGYTPSQIADYLARQSNFDLEGARKAGYRDEQILGHLAQQPKPEGAFDRAARIAQDSDGGVLAAAGSLIAAALPDGGDKRTSGGFVKDTAVDAVRGVVGLGQSVIGLGNLVSFGVLGKGMEALGYSGEQTQQFLGGLYTADRQQAEKNVEEAKGFFNTLGALAVNPSSLMGSVVQAIPQTVGAGAAGGAMVRALLPGATKAAAAAGVVGDDATKFITEYVAKRATVAAGVSEGALTAGSIAESGREAGQDFTTYAPAALVGGAATGIIGAASGAIGRRVGLGDIEADIAMRGAGVSPTTAAAAGSRLKTIGKEALKEGVLEEAPQSFQEALATQYAQGKPFDLEEAASQAAQGLATGGVMGGFNAAIRGRAPQEQPGPDARPAVNPDAQLDQTLNRLEAARNEVFLGTTDGRETIANIVAAPDLAAAVDAAEASVPSMEQLLQQKRAAATERVAQELGYGPAAAPVADLQQAAADAQQRSQAAIASVQAELGLTPSQPAAGDQRSADQIVADFEAKRASAIAELQGSPAAGAASPIDFEAKRKAAAERAIGEMGDSLPRFRYSPQMQGQREEAPSTQPELVSAYVEQMRGTNTPAARAFVQLFESGRITPADVADTIARQNPENRAPAEPVIPSNATPIQAEGIQIEQNRARRAPTLDLKNPEAAVAERAQQEGAPDISPELAQQRLEAAAAPAAVTPSQAQQYIEALQYENTPQARALIQEYRAGRVTDQDVAEAVNAQRRYQLGGVDLAQSRIEGAASQAPGPAQGLQVETTGARSTNPALAEAVALYGDRPLTAQDLTVEGASTRIERAGQQAQQTQAGGIVVEQGLEPRGAFRGRSEAIRFGNTNVPRPARIGNQPAASYSEQQLQSIVANQNLPAITRRGAQIELLARQQEQRSAQPATPAGVTPGGIIIPSEQRAAPEATTVAPEATQQGKPVSSLGNITTVDPGTLTTQSQTQTGTISRQTHRMTSLLASMFGKKVVVFESDNDMAPDGFVRRGDSKTIYLNRKSEISHLVVFGHELLHQLKADNPQAYAALVKVIRLKEGADTNVAGIRGDMEELTADVVGNRFREVEFWQDVFREILASGKDTNVSQRSAMRLGASVVRAVDRMVKALKGMTGFDTDNMVENLGEVKSAVTKALASYAQEKRGEAAELIRQEVAGQAQAAPAATGEVVTSDRRGRLDNVEAFHYSQAPRKTLSSAMFGTGLRGSSREEYLNAPDQRRRQRISFYFDKGTGVRPEAGVGGVPHRATLNNIYDSNADPLGLRKGGQAAFESKVLDAGFDGYLDRLEGSQPGQIIMLGQRNVPVQALPPGPVRSGMAVEPLEEKAPEWATQASGPTREGLEQRMARMQGQPQWADYDMQIVESGRGFFALQTRQKQDVTASEKRQVNTPEFKKWFGDSKVVDGRGRALVLYRGVAGFDSLPDRALNAEAREGYATFASNNPAISNTYANPDWSRFGDPRETGAIVPVYVKADRIVEFPVRTRSDGWRTFDKFEFDRRAKALRPGEVLVVRGVTDTGPRSSLEVDPGRGWSYPSDIYAWGPGTSVKSAIGNSGAFDASNPDIRASEKRILLNIGLSTREVKGKGQLTEDVVLSSLTKLGLKVDSMPVHPSDSEPTAVPAIDRPLTQEEGDDLSARLNQEAIVQRMPDGSGVLFGPKAIEWGPYNPEYFVMADGRRAVDYPIDVKASAKRRKTQVAGKEVPTSIDRAADSAAAFRRARGKVFDTNRELKTEIQDAVRAAAEDAGVDLSTFSEETEKYLVRIATAEAVKALRENANAIGWYREKVTKALRIAALKHPELNTDPESRMVFIWALAVTSNGMRVKKNFELADKAYSSWKRYKKFPTNIGQGTAKKAINNGLRAYNVLSKKMTFDQLHNAMLTKSPVAQIGKLLGIKPSGEYADTIVYGSAILGPKVGNGFFANLYGHYEQLTIDRWLMRTWGRWTGTLIEVKSDVVAKKADTLSALLDLLNAVQRTQLEQAIGRTVYLDDLEPTAAAISAATTKESVRDALDEVGPLDKTMRARLVEILGKEKANSKRVSLGDEIRKAGIGLYQAIDGQVEAPRDPQQRNDMRKVFDQVLAELQKTNPGLTMSDLQAVLWYPEKRIYDAAKTDKETDDGYEDGAAPDYANAAAEHYRGRGVAKSAIERVIAQVDSELQAANSSGPGGRSAGGVAQQPGGVSDPSVVASEKRVGDTSSPEFKEWFGDSQLVDADGEPVILYHGTQANNIRVFKRSEDGALGPGIYLTQSMDAASSYAGDGGVVEMLYARLERPLVVYTGSGAEPALQIARDDKFWKENFFTRAAARKWAEGQVEDWAGIQDPEFPQMLKDAGYDGVILKNPETGEIVEAMVPSAYQVKSAINDGEWSRSNPDIYASEKRQTDTPEFKAWFKDSKVVDENGEPLVVYHGTGEDFSTFRGDKWASFSADPSLAGWVAENMPTRRGERNPRPNVMPVYLAISRPLVVTDANADDYFSVGIAYPKQSEIDAIKRVGYDGIIYKTPSGLSAEIIAFRPEQIKSAIGNSGTFDPTNPDITKSEKRNIFGQKVQASWDAPADTKLDKVIAKLQDKNIDLRRVVETIKTKGGQLADQINAYLQEELYHGRTAKQTKDFLEQELKPLINAMQANRVVLADFEEYLHNRHAEERNRQIARINPAMPDGGSGIDTADARSYLAGLDPAKRSVYESLARQVDTMSKGTRGLMVSSGLESKDTIDTWERTYGSYVPLFREDADYGASGAMGSGQGFSVRGPASRRATGSSRPVVDILANLAMQRERTIVRAEKARVGRALYGLALQNPNSDYWMAVDPNAIKDVQGTMAQLVGMGLSPLDVQSIMQEPTQSYVDPRTGLVTQRVNPALRSNDNVLAVRIDGQDKYVFFNNRDERAQRMVTAMKNLDAQQLGMVMNMSAKVSRWFASVNTQYNPVFGAINLIRDTGGAAFNLTTTSIADRKGQVMKGIPLAMIGIYADIRSRRAGKGPTQGVWAGLWEEFQQEGGQTGFRDMFNTSEDRSKALEKELNRMQMKGYDPRRLVDPNNVVFAWLSDYNETLENAVRLSAYKAGKDKGLSNQQAASIAKNLTVNFNRKGEIGVQAGALYAFFNASVQGTARLAETLSGPAGKKIIAGGMLLGVAQALLLAGAGFKDDEPPDFIKERNLVIPIGDGKYITVPMPLGLNVIPNTSRVLTEYAMSGWKDPTKRVAQITGAFLEMFNPIGNAGWSVQTIAPTFADPLVALAENRDWTGKPIAKEDRSGSDPTPGYTRAKDTASALSKGLAYVLNAASGGTDYKQGLISPTPDQLDYLIGQITGGVGREALKVSQTVQSGFTGEELPSNKIPILGRFYGDTKEQSGVASKFYTNVTKLNEHENEIKGRIKDKKPLGDYMNENPEARLYVLGNAAERQVSELRRQKRDMIERGASKESIKLIEERITRRMKMFNDQLERVAQ